MANITGDNLKNVLIGTSADDMIWGLDGNDYLIGAEGDDVLYGGNGQDHLYGAVGTDTLYGDKGSDVLDGGEGADVMNGGAGDDVYYVDNAGDKVVETTKTKDSYYIHGDQVVSSISYTLPENVEILTLIGSADLAAEGNDKNNIITGNSGDNTLAGNGGNDVLDGLAGADVMRGGDGNDLYIVDNAGDVVEETNADPFVGGGDEVKSRISYTLPQFVEGLTLTGTDNIDGIGTEVRNVIVGNAGDNTLVGGGGNDTSWGNDGNDKLDGGEGNDALYGGAGTDRLGGGAGDDELVGGFGADIMDGGAGNNTYEVDNTGDVIIEPATNQGIATVYSAIGYTLATGLENLTLQNVDDAALNNINGAGNGLDNKIYGNDGDNTLTGGSGNDTLDGGVGNDKLLGGNGDDVLIGGSSDYVVDKMDTLSGGNGNDRLESFLNHFSLLTGGAGNDTFSFDITEFYSNSAVITDFTSGQDVIDLSEIVEFRGLISTFIGEQAFDASDARGQLRFDAASHMLLGSTDADTTAEIAINLLGVESISAADLIL